MFESENSKSMRERIRLISIRTVFSNGRGNPVAMIAGGGVLALFLHFAGTEAEMLGYWFLVLLTCGLSALFFDHHVFRVGITYANSESFLGIRMALGSAVALLFGLSALLIPEASADLSGLFGLIVVTTLSTVAYMTSGAIFQYCLAVNALSVLPYVGFFAYRFFAHGDRLALIAGLTSLVWHVIVISKAWHVSRYAVGVIRASERLSDEMAERREAENSLRISEDRAQQLATMLRLLCDNVPDMIWAKDLEHRFIFVNKAYALRLLGAADTTVPIGRTYADFFEQDRAKTPDNPEWHTLGEYSGDVDQHALTREEPTVFEESGFVRGRHMYLDIHLARFVNGLGQVIGSVGCARDITARKASEAYVQHLAHHDALTDLPNRLLLADRLKVALASCQRERSQLAVLFVDLDHLKPVNDRLGHDIGDLLLKEVALRLCQVVTRGSDTVARFGGDEFVVLLPKVNREHDAARVAARILEVLAEPLTIAGHDVSAAASIGIALYPEHGEDTTSLLRNADSAMYEAKNSGRNTYHFFQQDKVLGH